ncbi:MAG: spermidine/putrescine transport system ATP-binding protein [Solirubrobacteraceae bacterium]|nr:spermidine/putrescine transport system ATP-binding protein [Solirubrobacteraceae bacterium]
MAEESPTLQDMTASDAQANDGPDIRLSAVTKRFTDTVAVDDLSLDIERGSFFAMLGPSGCGKTTTLRMVGGFEDPTAGRVFLGGVDVTDHPPFRRDVNTVFQSYALFPHLTVERNVAFGLERRKVGRDEVRRRVRDILELVQLTGYEARRPSQLSGGQQQRVALARALVNHPRALLLDEPLGALDLRLRRQLQIELKRIQQDIGITFVHVTHDQEEALTMADTIAVMNEGRIEQMGSGEELYERPRTEFVANFLGISNLLDGTVGSRDGSMAVFHTEEGERVLVPSDRLAEIDGGAIRVGVRPEKITIAPSDGETSSSTLNAIHGRVTVASYLGVSIQYVVETPAGHELTVIAPNRDGAAANSIGPGRDVSLSWDPTHTFVVQRQESLHAP